MEANQRLFELLCMLIDIRIKKHVSLARIGVELDEPNYRTKSNDGYAMLGLFEDR